MQEEQRRSGTSSQFSIEMILPSAADQKNKISKVEDESPSDAPSNRSTPSISESYRPCLMVADTSDQSQECGASKKVRRPRTCFSDEQLKELERRFRTNKYVSVADRTLLCSELGLTDSQIKTWFQNRRTKWKRLNEARYNFLNESVDSRLLRKDASYYAHPGVTIPSFQSKASEQDITSSFAATHNIYSSFHSFPSYMWSGAASSYSPVYNPTLTGLPATSPQLTPLTVLAPLQSSTQGHTPTTSLSPNVHHQSEEEISSSHSQFHSLYPSSKSTPSYPTSKGPGNAPPYSTKEPELCVSPYSPYYTPACVDKSLRAQYQTALT